MWQRYTLTLPLSQREREPDRRGTEPDRREREPDQRGTEPDRRGTEPDQSFSLSLWERGRVRVLQPNAQLHPGTPAKRTP
jgi:hypothetical protein